MSPQSLMVAAAACVCLGLFRTGGADRSHPPLAFAPLTPYQQPHTPFLPPINNPPPFSPSQAHRHLQSINGIINSGA
jgi:hypothetical protein